MKTLSEEAKKLLESQLGVWELARNNYNNLSTVQSKEIDFGHFKVRVQFNPARIQSSAAKVDAKSIQERKCFLCPTNLPVVQEGIDFDGRYQILVNPFPIFPEHFTIPAYDHVDQLIFDRFEDMLTFSQLLDKYTLFYNGPKCGASAPDHVHFQAGSRGFMPIEGEVKNIDKQLVVEDAELKVYALRNYLRNSFLIESTDKEKATSIFKKLYASLEIKDGEQEPMMNVLAWYEEGVYHVVVLPREQHRPSCFFAEGDANILISPASVDLGGVFITPQEKDFNKITENDIEAILKEICIDDTKFDEIIKKLSSN